jgi:aldose 1-epimerase
MAGQHKLVTIRGESGLRAILSPVGAKLVALFVPTRDGGEIQVVIGSSAHPDDAGADASGGAICGRVANRVAGGVFELDGQRFELPINKAPNTLHGGPIGFSRREWTVAKAEESLVEFRLLSADGDMGFPGTLDARATYGIEGTSLYLDMTAETDRPTPINLTNHVYLNLRGAGSALGHQVEILASHYTPVNEALIPTGEIADVTGTRFDFRRPRAVAEDYDINFCLDAGRGPQHLAAHLVEPDTGRTMTLTTTEPGVQLYTATHFSEALISPFSKVVKNGGIALEPQTYPNAINEPAFPSSVLRPGGHYAHRIEWAFSGF